MRIFKTASHKIVAVASAMTVLSASVLSVSAASPRSVRKGDSNISVYVTVEKSVFNAHNSLIEEPVTVQVPTGSNALDALETAIGSANVNVTTEVYNGTTYHYVAAIKDPDNTGGSKYFANTVPSSGEYSFVGSTDSSSWNGIVHSNSWLTQLDYNKYAGWMISVNNVAVSDGVDTALHSGDVVRMEYTLYTGCDLGWDGWVQDSSGNWVEHAPFYTGRADKTELIQDMAADGPVNPYYNEALGVLQNLQASASDVESAIENLNDGQQAA